MAEASGPPIARAVAVGLVSIGGFFIGFGGWAVLAPLQSAVVAAGVVQVESHRKTIQHLEGGIIRAILVKNGDHVSAGQALIHLDDTQSNANFVLLDRRRDIAMARLARLNAERDEAAEINFPSELLARAADPMVAELIAAQREMFRTHGDALRSQIAIEEMRILQFQSEIAGLRESIAAEDRELALLNEEIEGLEILFAKKIVAKPRLLALQRRAAEIEGMRGRHRAAIQRAEQGIDEARLRIAGHRTAVTNKASADLDELQASLIDVNERLRVTGDVRRRATITAPHAGVVVNLRVHTPGGVVAPGETLLDLVPTDDRLIVEARIDPKDADRVHQGLDAEVRISSFNQRHAPTLQGRVTYVSADRLQDEQMRTAYYNVRVELVPGLPAPETVTIQPGMPAEVIISTGTRTLADYLLEPIAGVVRRAMRES